MKNPAAVALGKLGKGVKRKFSPAEIKKRTERLKKYSRHNKGNTKMKILLMIITMMIAVSGFAQAKDVKDFKFADGACYYVNSQNVPVIKDGYWGYATIRWDSNSNSKYAHITVNGVEKTLFVVGDTADRQSNRCVVIKMSGGTLKAFLLSDPTPEQLKNCIEKRKAYEYNFSTMLKIQDGITPCEICNNTGQKESKKQIKAPPRYGVKNTGMIWVACKIKCENCNGAGAVPKMIKIPGVKIIE